MRTTHRHTLLQDLAKLLARYPAEEWHALISALQDEMLRKQTTAAIEALIPLARSNPRAMRNAKAQDAPGTVLEKLRSTEPEKADLLTSLRLKLHEGAFLPTAKALRDFASICGMKRLVYRKRAQAINQLILHLANLPLPEINRVLSENTGIQRDFGAEYERWVELILGRKSTSAVEAS